MKSIKKYLPGIVIYLMILSPVFLHSQVSAQGSSEVRIEQINGQYRLTVNGDPFFVNGAGCEFGNIEALAAHGANSFRTWRTENGQQDAIDVLNEAHENGLMVLMGLEVGHERHGYDYSDTAWVRQQFDYLKGEVERLKDHPALLGWAIGNELNLQVDDLRAFKEVDRISRMIHRIDPHHPTTTTLAGISKREVDYIHAHCMDIDFISIQMYGDIVNLQQRIADAGWEGPYMVTEWGATGHWEVARTDWDVAIEQTSREKAEAIKNRYNKAILADSVYCLGSYVFLWGQKQERTPTWYGLFTENGEMVEAIDMLQHIWTGEWPVNRCPSITSFLLDGKTAHDNVTVVVGETLQAVAEAEDADADPLEYRWEILHESTDLGTGGDYENRPPAVLQLQAGEKLSFSAPEEPGAYRIFVYATDGNKHAATANIPFYVNDQKE